MALLAGLGLIVLLPLTGRSAAGNSSQATWRHTLQTGESLRVKQSSLSDGCQAPHLWRAEGEGGFIRLDRPVGPILIKPGATELVGVILDAGRKEKLYRGSVSIECLDCNAETNCEIRGRDVFPIELTVVKPTPTSEQRKVVAERLPARLISELEHLSSWLDERVQKLEVVEGIADGQRQEEYSDAQVGDIIKKVRERLVVATKVSELRALGAYAIEHHRPESYLVKALVSEVAAPLEARLPLFLDVAPFPSLPEPAQRAIDCDHGGPVCP